MKFHLTDDGPRLCRAFFRSCRRRTVGNSHFDTLQEAQSVFDRMRQGDQESSPAVKKDVLENQVVEIPPSVVGTFSTFAPGVQYKTRHVVLEVDDQGREVVVNSNFEDSRTYDTLTEVYEKLDAESNELKSSLSSVDDRRIVRSFVVRVKTTKVSHGFDEFLKKGSFEVHEDVGPRGFVGRPGERSVARTFEVTGDVWSEGRLVVSSSRMVDLARTGDPFAPERSFEERQTDIENDFVSFRLDPKHAPAFTKSFEKSTGTGVVWSVRETVRESTVVELDEGRRSVSDGQGDEN